MPELSPTEARTKFIDLLNETVFQTLALKELLEEERSALEAQDIDRISVLSGQKNTCVESLKDLDENRISLCARCGFLDDLDQMSKAIQWCDDDGLIESRWQHVLLIAAESSALNITNGAIIRLRQQQFDSSLSVLRGETPGANTYGRHGDRSSDYGHRSLAEA